MKKVSPIVREYIYEIVYSCLDAMRSSVEMEERYKALDLAVKRATTDELKIIANRATDFLISKKGNVNALVETTDDRIFKEALLATYNQKDNRKE